MDGTSTDTRGVLGGFVYIDDDTHKCARIWRRGTGTGVSDLEQMR